MWWFPSGHGDVIVPFIGGGVGAGFLFEALYKWQWNLPPWLYLAIVAVIALLALWNAVMYRKAARQTDPEFPRSAVERYTRPVGASVSFVGGFLLIAYHTLARN
jgi:hypothetical protein